MTCHGGLTDNEVRIKLVSNRHHHLLESKQVIGISHALCRPRNVDVPTVVQLRASIMPELLRTSLVQARRRNGNDHHMDQMDRTCHFRVREERHKEH